MRNVIIYELIDPDTMLPMYIGKTVLSIEKRFNNHIYCATLRKNRTRKDNWIFHLLKQNKRPIIQEVDICDESNWEFWEKHYISLYKYFGFQLLNHLEGGKVGFELKKLNKILKTGNQNRCKKVLRIDSEGTHHLYKSCVEVGKIFNVDYKIICDLCKDLALRTYLDSNWYYVKDYESGLRKKETQLNYSRIKVKCLTTNTVFNSISEAANFLNTGTSNISKVCRGKLPHIKKHKFEYA